MIFNVIDASWDAWHTNIGMSMSRTIYSDDATRMNSSNSIFADKAVTTYVHQKRASFP